MNRQADGGAPATEGNGERIGLVLAGGGARGACEAGALSVLLPALEARGERVSVIVGTSVGTLNAAWLAANVHRPVTGLVEAHKRLWRELRWEDVLAPVWSRNAAAPMVRYLFFAPEFAEALLTEGAKDARAWLSAAHDEGIWQKGPLKDGPLGERRPEAVHQGV